MVRFQNNASLVLVISYLLVTTADPDLLTLKLRGLSAQSKPDKEGKTLVQLLWYTRITDPDIKRVVNTMRPNIVKTL